MSETNDFEGLPRVDRTDDRDERSLTAGLTAVFALVAVLTAVDLATDVREGTWLRHVLIEGSVTLVGLMGFVWMALRFRAISSRAHRLAEHAQHLEQSLEASRREAEKWRREAGDLIAGLSQAIDRQLERWGLSAAEKEVALLLLKGLSHKEIAGIRGVGEATVRQQAMALYRKAGLEGRHDLAAFFLEDLLEPQPR